MKNGFASDYVLIDIGPCLLHLLHQDHSSILRTWVAYIIAVHWVLYSGVLLGPIVVVYLVCSSLLRIFQVRRGSG